jgi:hypothetical protein
MMTVRPTMLLAAALLAGSAAPALAQEAYDPGEPPPLPELSDHEWNEWEAEGVYEGDDYGYSEEYASDYPPPYPGPQHEYGSQPMGYSPMQRAAWLDECRARVGADGRERGTAIGGVLGAVAGGVAGNRIAGGNRLAGTMIGAGVGGVAGAIIGGELGDGGDAARYDQCEAYLLDYERAQPAPQAGYGYGYGYGPPPGYAYGYPGPVMWVRVPIMRERRGDCGCEHALVEEVVEETVVERAPPPVRQTKVRRVRAGKAVPLPRAK